MRLVCPTRKSVSHTRLLCLIWDWCVPCETAISPLRLISPTCDCSVCLKWDCSVPHETSLSYMRLICHIWDCSVLYETALSHIRLICPKRDCSVPHEAALSHMILLQVYFVKHKKLCIFFLFFVFLLSVPVGTELVWDWDGTGTRLGLDWDISRTGTMQDCIFE